MNSGPKIHQYNYQNLTISGLPGCGSTTLLNLLREQLKLDGWRGFSGGEFMRAYAAEKGLFDQNNGTHHDASYYEDEFDKKVDFGMREKLETESNWILESWLSGFMAQQVSGVLKVLMVCSDDAVRVDRIVNRDKISVVEAKKHLHQRYDNNYAIWSRLYQDQWREWVVEAGVRPATQPIDFWHPDLYDLVIDTYSNNQQQTLKLVLNAFQKK